MAVFFLKHGAVPSLAPPVGTTWLYEEDGTFDVPATGNYEIELHGGGAGGAVAPNYWCGGGGSGQLQEVYLQKGEVVPITIGSGSSGPSSYTGLAGNPSQFGEYVQVDGGGRAGQAYGGGGAASGNIATNGTSTYSSSSVNDSLGGLGNKNKPDQLYGNGAYNSGQPGACIITFLGVS